MSAKHTPGPWEIDWYICREGNEELWRVPRSIGPAHVDHNHWAGKHIAVDEANARLIAAAPDLLFQLQAAANYIDTLGGVSTSYRAAIAKAEAA